MLYLHCYELVAGKRVKTTSPKSRKDACVTNEDKIEVFLYVFGDDWPCSSSSNGIAAPEVLRRSWYELVLMLMKDHNQHVNSENNHHILNVAIVSP